jgi:hypothetical protein
MERGEIFTSQKEEQMEQIKKMIAEEVLPLKKRIFELEVKLSEFTEMRHDKNRSDIDYIAMETGVDIDQEG